MNKPWTKKLTKPKSPFSKKRVESIEARNKRIENLKPSIKFHNFATIQWIRHRYNEDVIKKSIFSLLPNNGKPEISDDESKEERKHRLLMEWLSTYAKPKDKFKYLNIKPKYFFNEKTYEKVLKLKEIFLDFDEDGSRKMEINEMEEMFNSNHINADINELVSLFFKDKNIKQEEIMSLYLDFYQFMEFALTKDQDFRLFMRKIKQKYKTGGINNKDKGFLPMNFNLVLDYFIIKGKERTNIDSIKNTIKEMNKIINIEDDAESEKKDDNESEVEEKKSEVSNSENNEPISCDEQLEKINFDKIIKNFQSLFRINEEEGNKEGENLHKRRASINTKIKGSSVNDSKISSSNNLKIHSRNSLLPIEPNSRDNSVMDESEESGNVNNNFLFTDIINNKIINNDIDRMNYTNYKKFHSLKLALDETKRQLEMQNNRFGKYNLNNFYGTQYSTTEGNCLTHRTCKTTSLNCALPTIQNNYINNSNKTTYNNKDRKTSSYGLSTQTTCGTFRKTRKVIKNDYVPPEFLK